MGVLTLFNGEAGGMESRGVDDEGFGRPRLVGPTTHPATKCTKPRFPLPQTAQTSLVVGGIILTRIHEN